MATLATENAKTLYAHFVECKMEKQRLNLLERFPDLDTPQAKEINQEIKAETLQEEKEGLTNGKKPKR